MRKVSCGIVDVKPYRSDNEINVVKQNAIQGGGKRVSSVISRARALVQSEFNGGSSLNISGLDLCRKAQCLEALKSLVYTGFCRY